jgi:hypothetical protein
VGGEVFYERIRELLGRPDVDRAADVLEVYVLCLLLGFRGRYSGGGEAERQHWIATASQRIGQSRGTRATLCAGWAPPTQERIQPPADPWVLRLALGAAACIVIAWCSFSYSRSRSAAVWRGAGLAMRCRGNHRVPAAPRFQSAVTLLEALLLFMVLVWFVGTWAGLTGAKLWALRIGLWVLGLAAAGIIYWFLRPAGKRTAGAAFDELEAALATARARLRPSANRCADSCDDP